MCFFTAPYLLAIDFPIGRVDRSSMSDQTLMEILVCHLNGNQIFKDKNGEFLSITQWDGIAVDENGHVHEIDFTFDERNLFHDFYFDDDDDDADCYYDDPDVIFNQGGSIDFQWIPPFTQFARICNLKLAGTIKTSELPDEVSFLDISNNEITGMFNMDSMPKGIRSIDIHNNLLEGTLNLSAKLENLKDFDGSENLFTGKLDFTSLPESVRRLDIHGNQFSGSIDLISLSEEIELFNISENQFSQERLVIGQGAANIGSLYIDRHQFGEIVDNEGHDFQWHLSEDEDELMNL